jgi:hypothetical protein
VIYSGGYEFPVIVGSDGKRARERADASERSGYINAKTVPPTRSSPRKNTARMRQPYIRIWLRFSGFGFPIVPTKCTSLLIYHVCFAHALNSSCTQWKFN